jgi:hypothetical protein
MSWPRSRTTTLNRRREQCPHCLSYFQGIGLGRHIAHCTGVRVASQYNHVCECGRPIMAWMRACLYCGFWEPRLQELNVALGLPPHREDRIVDHVGAPVERRNPGLGVNRRVERWVGSTHGDD